ncbi:GerAB/ArcD/ProY family transporter [Paenibacillus qinlingensis]|uniref:Spore germination protein (Amino acid permease) n=1 Tax=Paenibacillus qinlingensis TaxID=1837343 RepID=A0ABU1NT75_9BACL|nr:GerAB/ArcD/ProY family transporter [Paenibacillus qinlingensis]MDR6550681.1 spore germination protein (amino acid permease) [Paenibacillus qinlingensis]
MRGMNGENMKARLHPLQLSIFIYSIQNSLVLYTLPRLTAQYFGTNGWLSLIFIFILVNMNIGLIAISYKLGKGRSIFEIIEVTVPRWVMVPFYLFIIGVWIGMASMIMREYIFIMKLMFYPTLPAIFFVIFFSLLSFQLLRGGFHHIVKAIVVLFFFVIPMIFLLFYLTPEFEFARFTPFFFKGGTDFFKGTLQVYSAFLGIEVSMLFFPIVENKWTKTLFIGNFLSTFTNLLVSFMCFGFFSFNQILNDLYPVMTLFEYTEVSFLSRAENLCFCVFSFKVLSTAIIYYWGAQQFLGNMMKSVKPTVWIIIIVTMGFILALLPDSMLDVKKWLTLLSNCSIGIAWALPLFVLGNLSIQILKKRMPRETEHAK